MKTRMKSAIGLAATAALAEATTAPTGTLPASLRPLIAATGDTPRATPPRSRRTRFTAAGTVAEWRESDTPTDDTGVWRVTRLDAAREDRRATPLFAVAEATRPTDPELDESAAGPSAWATAAPPANAAHTPTPSAPAPNHPCGVWGRRPRSSFEVATWACVHHATTKRALTLRLQVSVEMPRSPQTGGVVAQVPTANTRASRAARPRLSRNSERKICNWLVERGAVRSSRRHPVVNRRMVVFAE